MVGGEKTKGGNIKKGLKEGKKKRRKGRKKRRRTGHVRSTEEFGCYNDQNRRIYQILNNDLDKIMNDFGQRIQRRRCPREHWGEFPSVCPSLRPFFCPFFHPSVQPSVYLSICLFVRPSTRSSSFRLSISRITEGEEEKRNRLTSGPDHDDQYDEEKGRVMRPGHNCLSKKTFQWFSLLLLPRIQ